MKSLKLIKGYQYFEAQEKNEEVLLIVRMHWLILLAPFIYGVIGTIIICGFAIMVINNIPNFINQDYSELVFRAAFSNIILFGSLYVFSAWLVRYLNVFILTNKHIVDVNQTAFFARKVSTLSLENIEDVSIVKKGIWSNIFDYGDVMVQTAGELPNFSIDRVGDPEAIQKSIMEAKETYVNHPHVRHKPLSKEDTI